MSFIIREQDLALEPNQQGERSGKILIGLKAYDRDGKAINWEGDIETLDMKPSDSSALQQTGISAHLEIDLPSSMDINLMTAVYDWSSGKAGTMEIPLRPDAAKAAQTKSTMSRN